MKEVKPFNSNKRITEKQYNQYLLKVLRKLTIEELEELGLYDHLVETLDLHIINKWQEDHEDSSIVIKWEESMIDDNVLYNVGQLENGKYFWTWDLDRQYLETENILNFPSPEEYYGGFIFKDLKRILKSIQFDCLFEERYIDDTDDHPVYLWAKEQFNIKR